VKGKVDLEGCDEKCDGHQLTSDARHSGKVIEVEGLTVVRSGQTVIQNASFVVHAGDYIGMVGPNGGGKTTILKAVLGVIPFVSGRVRLFGHDLRHFKDWGRIAYLSQNAIAFDEQFPLSVRELVSLGRLTRKRMGRPLGREDRKTVEGTLKYMGISDLAKKRIGQLSGGQKQRVVLAKALVRDPSILILDEPVSGVDSQTQERFYKLLSDLNLERKMTILMVSHDLAAVFCRMSHMICVNRLVRTSPITDHFDPNPILKETYGEHFQFAYHQHQCKGEFKDG
jgi:zinc transport system ATP-binding protein